MLNVLLDYLLGFLFVAAFLIIIPAFGRRLTKNNYSYSFSLIIGYVVYTFLQFIGGFITQLLELPWLFYCAYMLVLVMGISAFSYSKLDIKKTMTKVKEHVCNYWFLYFIASILTVFSIMNMQGQMLTNHLDDGYYLTRVALTPYIGKMDLGSSGVLSGGMDLARIFNTHEIELGFYSNVLRIEPTLFCRLFVNLLHYCIYLHVIYAFIEKIQLSLGDKSKKIIQFFMSFVLLFGMSYAIFHAKPFFSMQDSWQFSTAMWYGSSIVRICSIFIIFVPLLEIKKINVKNSCYFIIASCALMSKASQALPILAISFLILISFVVIEKFNKKSLMFIVPLIVVLVLFPNLVNAQTSNEISSVISTLRGSNQFTILMCISIPVFIISFFSQSKFIKKWNVVLLVFGLIIFVPLFENFFQSISLYNFVAARTTTTWYMTFYMTNFVYLVYGITLLAKKEFVSIIINFGVSIAIIFSFAYGYQSIYGFGNFTKYKSQYYNIIPQPTLKLSNELEKIALEEDKTLNVVSPYMISSNGYDQALAIMLRVNAPHIRSVTSLIRYPTNDEDSLYYDYLMEDYLLLIDYIESKLEDTAPLQEYLDQYDVNCVVIHKEEVMDNFTRLGFELSSLVEAPLDGYSYYILTR